MKIYLSGPMSGKPHFNIPAFRETTERLRSRGHLVVSPHELDEESGIGEVLMQSETGDLVKVAQGVWGDLTWSALIGRDMEIIADDNFDAIYLLRDWQYSKGARLEVVLGLMLGLMLFDYETGLQIPTSEAMKVISYTILEGK